MTITVPDDCTLSEAIARCNPWHNCRPIDLYLGKQVLARNTTTGGGKYYRGEIAAINKGGTYAIQFVSDHAKTTKNEKSSHAAAAADAEDDGMLIDASSNEEGRMDACVLRDIKLLNKIEKDNYNELLILKKIIFIRNGIYNLGGRVLGMYVCLFCLFCLFVCLFICLFFMKSLFF